ncbi:tyrosine-type recombinase/integrase [Polaribacter sargassicola]|uniref:tyrosine-type recombinase/integrase n=1 Tax=Polaribacter sargassicola TaxID=2836891 RepID=UPI001F01A675|nr:tyrosine-type recombinase/integrase [Polaribacter sp. DS7-9]MCG1035767.1 tyrosine-type recombinase/integrase [Polaribacter sp. DS7-9]
MATLQFLYRSKKEKGNLTIRFRHSSNIHYRYTTKIVSNKEYWFTTKGKHKNLNDIANKGTAEVKNHKKDLEDIRDKFLLKFTTEFNSGVVISREWFKETLSEIVTIVIDKLEIEKRQKAKEQKELEILNKEQSSYKTNLVTSAIQRVIDVEYFDKKDSLRLYNQLKSKIVVYQEVKKVELKTKDITQDFINSFYAFLVTYFKHSHATSNKHCKSLTHAVRYQKNAFPNIVEVSHNINSIKYKRLTKSEIREQKDEIVIPLSFEELDLIHNTEVPTRLQDAKKTILFISEVGLRVSDFNKLTDENIKTNKQGVKYWGFWNKKTGYDVVLPINKRILKYIDCYGKPKTTFKENDDVILNEQIKDICKIAGIDELVKSRKSQSVIVNGEKTRRTISKVYKKYEIITNHSFRRTFATNYVKIIGAYNVRAVTGHKSDEMLYKYINESAINDDQISQMYSRMNENADRLEQKHIKTQLNIIKNVSNQ